MQNTASTHQYIAPTHDEFTLEAGSGLLIVLFLIGCAASTFKAMVQKSSFTTLETWGRIGLGGFLSMAAAATPVFFPSASAQVQCGIAAALAILGDAFVMAMIKQKFGVSDASK